MKVKVDQGQSESQGQPFYLTGWGVALLSLFSAGIALPFLLWARGPKTRVRRNWIIGTSTFAVATLLVIGANEPAIEEPEEPVSAETTSTSVMPSTTTTTTLPKPRVDDLPTAELGSQDKVAVQAAQTLIRLSDPSVARDGIWGPQTQRAMDALRADYGLGAGGLDLELWEAIFSRKASETLAAINGPQNLKIPAAAIYVDANASGFETSFAARYVLPFSASSSEISRWVRANNPRQALGDWRWCEEISNRETPLMMFWWQRAGRQLSISVVEQRGGRVDLEVAIEEGTDPEGCEGAARRRADLEIDSRRY